MAKVRVPLFLVRQDKEEKHALMSQLASWKQWAVHKVLVEYLEDRLDALIKEDENETFMSKFRTLANHAKRMGRRAELRALIRDLK